MSKIQIIDSKEGTQVPFLRGILTRSLHEAGLSFDDAYDLATTLRQEISDIPQLTTEELRNRVIEHLRKSSLTQIISNYQNPVGHQVSITVRDRGGHNSPFSRGLHQRSLESCGIASKDARLMTVRIYRDLGRQGLTEIDSTELGRLTYNRLQQAFGTEIARRYKIWVHYKNSGRPLLLLIGGTTGCGKSTIATEVAHHLEIVRTQSTDMLREVMRMMISKRLLPVLHESSFNAWQALGNAEQAQLDPAAALANGYRNQAELLAVPCEAVMQRALKERVSLILEGVHVRPALLERIPPQSDAVIVPVMLAVLNKDSLRNRISGRGLHAPGRAVEYHKAHFEAIWSIQSLLLSEADQAQVSIVSNEQKEKAVNIIMATIIDSLSKGFSASPDQVFA